MNKDITAFHGSDLEKIEAVYGIKKETIINFAANVNPLGFSKKAAKTLAGDLSIISRYPDPSYTDLKNAIHSYTGADTGNIILGNGVTELLSLFLNVLSPRHAVIIGPTYSEYEKDLNRIGASIHYIDAKESDSFVLSPDDILNQTPENTDLVILCNPNNPTSGALRKAGITKIAHAYSLQNIYLLIDETYVEFSPESDDLTAADLTNRFDNLFILRGTSKFFATPGLRLGYALSGSPELTERLRNIQDPWNINSVAEIVGTVMFTDTEYIRMVRTAMEQEKQYMCDALSSVKGMRIYPVNGNIILAKLPEGSLTSDELFDVLIRQGLMIRSCSTFRTLGDRFIRICFMGHEDNVRLIHAIKSVL